MLSSAGWWSALLCTALAAATLPGRVAVAAAQDGLELPRVLARAGARVEEFFTRAQSLICTETVSLQRLSFGFTPEGFPRTVESELRLSWEPGLGGPATEALTERQVLRVNGRPPREDDPNSCTTPEQESTETQPLSMLLPQQQAKYEFSLAGIGTVDGREAVMIDFREPGPVAADVQAVEGQEDCIRYDLTGGQRGRLWIDRETFDVLRLDQRLAGMVDLRLPRVLTRRPGISPYLTLERSDTSIRFGRVSFENPEESIVLPISSMSLRILRGGGAPRLRTITKYSNYRRFLTGGRVIGDAP